MQFIKGFNLSSTHIHTVAIFQIFRAFFELKVRIIYNSLSAWHRRAFDQTFPKIAKFEFLHEYLNLAPAL